MLLIVLGNTQQWTWHEFSGNGSLTCEKIICRGSASLVEFQWFWNTRYARERILWEGIFSRRKRESIIVCYENAKEDHVDYEIPVEVCCNWMQHSQTVQASVYCTTSLRVLSKKMSSLICRKILLQKKQTFLWISFFFRLRTICTWWSTIAVVECC